MPGEPCPAALVISSFQRTGFSLLLAPASTVGFGATFDIDELELFLLFLRFIEKILLLL